ncbi:heme lyase CcmF/NrfE family subunit [Chitinibacter sp. ZOR0017]|uniref:heme lyase CcmF/NrfE family subunit n=1 Tax=Chitinibacter sp. ZOR0017 TaxID=1339254 RepID=UPI00064815E6|nr:heme lyase CcmF/NrfE family subunit [Chitinibacter sp. ZOR0017]
MIVELGHFSLILAFCLAFLLGGIGLKGSISNEYGVMRVIPISVVLLFGLILAAFSALAYAFLRDDFSVQYVMRQSNSLLPPMYKLAALWGGHEGSLLLWVLLLGGWMLALQGLGRHLPLQTMALVQSILALVGSGFLLFILLTSNPFIRLLPAAAEGNDLNPLLQDIGLILHPPLLYMGYVGFSVAFAFAIAALITGRLDAAWARFSRPWTMAAWAFLTLGIMLGSAWAYYELGWGGWWFWDPVENASFMPWLAGTALMHSLAVAEKRGAFRQWTVLLALAAFSLSLLGTFLVRSGVLSSVHAFATDPARGTFILLFLCVVIGGSLALYAWRAPQMEGGGQFALFSRETLLLLNNLLLTVACATVLLGTLYPLLIDALGQGKLSVGAPYFNRVFVPLMLPLLFLLGLTTAVRWKQQSAADAIRSLRSPAVLALLLGGLSPQLFGEWRWGVALLLALAWWIVLTAVADLSRRCSWPTLANAGMHLAHIGMAVFLAGATVVSVYEQEKDVRLDKGERVELAGYTLQFNGIRGEKGANYMALRGQMALMQQGQMLATLQPEKRQYLSSAMPMTEAAIHHTLLADVYVSLGEMTGSNPLHSPWIVRVYYKPLVGWIWYGCLLMALGALLAACDRRYRLRKAKP